MDGDAAAFFGAQIEKLRLLKRTARGEVWLAIWKPNRVIVWKRMHAAGLPYALLAEHPHPLWPTVLCCAEDGTDTVVAEEYIEGEPLSVRLAAKRFLPEREAASVLLQLCDGLSVLHGLGIIHRDIKPSNLILREGIVHLIDFDAARTVKEEQPEDTALLGTKGYAPPEQFGYGQTDARSDIYAVGVTLAKLLGPEYRGWLLPVLEKCTELDPKRRYASAAEVKRAVLMRRRWAKAKNVCPILLAALVGATLYFLPAPSAPSVEAPPAASEPESENVPVSSEPTPSIQEERPPDESKKADASRASAEKNEPTPNEEIAPLPEEMPAPPKAAKGYVRATYYLNGERLGEWTDRFDYPINNWSTTQYVHQEQWQTWRTAEGGVFLPSSWMIRVHIENLADTPFEAARLRLEYNDRGRIETDSLRTGTIPPGGETDLTVPLGRYRVDAPGTGSPLPTLKLSLSGEGVKEIRGERTEWAIDLLPQGKESALDIIKEQERR